MKTNSKKNFSEYLFYFFLALYFMIKRIKEQEKYGNINLWAGKIIMSAGT